ncbi:flagellar basal body-associated FliL family protein [Marinobacterium aestuariivivens]|uniref:Flagellar protein FliL n=1 Tax=Marinobacterium aestuariivivens TaxID=1698799 RepID=A0ABW2A063_9GAMM
MVRNWVLGVLLALWLPLGALADESAEDYVNYIELKPFIANFSSEGTLRFVKCEITIQVSSPEAHHAVNYHLPHIRNDIVFLLSAQTEEQLATVEAQQTLAHEALERVQTILVAEEGEAFVTDLFFTSLVIQ